MALGLVLGTYAIVILDVEAPDHLMWRKKKPIVDWSRRK